MGKNTVNKVKVLREALRLNKQKFAEFLDIPYMTVVNWEVRNSIPKAKYIEVFAEKIQNFNKDYFLKENEENWFLVPTSMGSSQKNVSEGISERIRPIPVYSRIAAGSETEIFDNPLDFIYLAHPEINNLKGEVVGFSVKGDSMRPRITEGDTLITKMLNLPTEKPRDRDLIVTVFYNQVNSSEGNLKLFSWEDKNKGKFILSSINSRYLPRPYSMKDVRYMFRVYLVISKVDYKDNKS